MEDKDLELKKNIWGQYDTVCPVITDHFQREEKYLDAGDGTMLRTIIFKPEGLKEEAFPTIVIRTCYPMQEPMMEAQGEGLAKRGFAFVYQWCRGTGGSQGAWEPYFHEREDGISLINYLQDQAWVKNMGFTGGSYLALTGWCIADIVPDKMKTMYLTVLGTEWHKSLWQEGAFRQDVYTSWLMSEAGVPWDVDYLSYASYRPQVKADTQLWKKPMPVYRDFITKAEPSDSYWTEGYWGELQKIPAKIKMPLFIGEGWYDIHLTNSLLTYAALSDEAKAHTVVSVNPGNHPMEPVIYGQKKQEHARVYEFARQLDWFNRILVKEELPDPSINYYMIGEDKWRTYDHYPVEPDKEEVFYLSGKKLTAAPQEDGSREYDYDPQNPVMSHGGGTLFRTGNEAGSLKQPEADFRPDVLSYISEPLTQPIDCVGDIKARLWVESDAPDTCFTIKVSEVFENGETYNIRNGITTLGLRNSAKKFLPYEGGPVEITIECWDIAWQLQKGSRLRVDISSSNFPEFSVHPNTTGGWASEENPIIAHQKILEGSKYPSRLILPVK